MKLHRLRVDVKKYLATLACVEKSTRELPNLKISRLVWFRMRCLFALSIGSLTPAGQGFKLPRKIYPCPRVCAHLTSSFYYEDDNTLTQLLHCKVEHINKK